MNHKHLISVVGPTAIGKTTKSIEIAQALRTEIISCDSRQFYKEMSIGTAVPSQEELITVPHHFIQHLSIFDDYSVGHFEKEALQVLTHKFQQYDYLIITGGSGLYQKAVLEGFNHFPNVDKSIRENLNKDFESFGIKSLQEKLKSLDPEYYKIVDLNNPHRLIRALEICIGTNTPFSSYLNKNIAIDREFNSIKIGLHADREVIYNRIEQRVDEMISNGLINEAESLYKHKHLNALQTVGYRELFEYFDDKISLEKAIEEIKKNTRRYAKRQLTWYRKQTDIQWFDYQTDYKEIVNYIKQTST